MNIFYSDISEILSNDNAKTKEFMKYVTIENSDRTLVVNNVNALFAGEDNESTRFKCEGERGGVKKDGQIFGNFDQPVQFFLPEVITPHTSIYMTCNIVVSSSLRTLFYIPNKPQACSQFRELLRNFAGV